MVILPDFPHTWKRLSPEMKHVANRRLAIDAAEADLDEAGGMSQWKGFKLAMTDRVSRAPMRSASHGTIKLTAGQYVNFLDNDCLVTYPEKGSNGLRYPPLPHAQFCAMGF